MYQLNEGKYLRRLAKGLNLGVLRVEAECVMRQFTTFSSSWRISGQVYSVFPTCGLHERGGGHRIASRNVVWSRLRESTRKRRRRLIGRIAVSDDRMLYSAEPSRNWAILVVNSCPSCCRRVRTNELMRT